MTLLSELVCGSQSPTLHKAPTGPEIDYALADDVLSWVDSIGISLFPWQRMVLRQSLARRGSKWAAYEVDLVVPRQNGKNEILVALELAAVAVLGKRLVVHSAHEASTSQKHFKRFQELAERLPEFRKMLPATKTLGFYTSNGKEHIELRNGASIDFRTRTKGGGRGFSSDLVVLDEAFNLTAQAVGSLMYTLRARRDPQLWKTSSAAHADSLVLHNDRRRAVADDPADDRLLYMEWGNEPDAVLDDEATWLRSNPSVGMIAPEFSLELQTFRNEWNTSKGDASLRAEFAREVCGIPEPEASDGAGLGIPNWHELKRETSTIVDGQQWAVAISPDRSWSALAKAGRNADGAYHVERMEHKPGTGWIVPMVADYFRQKPIPIRVHKSGPEASLIPELVEAGVQVVEVSSADVARATGQIIDAAANGKLAHIGQPSLDKSVAGAVLRTSTDGASVWSQLKSSIEITPLLAVTVALGGVAKPGEYDVLQSVL